MNKPAHVLGFGTILVDHQVLLERFPDVDTKNPISSDRHQVGGPVPTALAMLVRLGLNCQFIGKWADDAYGKLITDDLTKTGIDWEHSIVRPDGRTGFAQVWIDESSGSRTVAYSRGNLGEISAKEIGGVDVPCRVLHLDGWSGKAAMQIAEAAKQQGSLVTLDAGSPKPGTRDLLPLVDFMNCPARFAREFFGNDDQSNAARQLLDAGVSTVIFTNGAKGCTCYRGQETFQVPAFSIQPKDTTGAGDVFCGGLIYGLVREFDLMQTIRFASACAALKCTKIGNRDALPNLDEIESLLSST